ncbi:MAG: hypothetical protein HWD92_01100 [Flavobacteriia bacterium]|nr:hypothetical protein [Flavobacteriia bacterium]
MKIKNIFLVAFMLVGMVALAQPGNPSTPAPIDGGLSLLIAAGVGLGAKKVHDARKNS